MNTSADAADQVVRMSLNGAEVALKVSGKGAVEISRLLIKALKSSKNQQHKTKGSIRLNNLVRSGKKLDVVEIADGQLKRFCETAKKYGILYTVLKDRNANDGKTELMYKAEDKEKVGRILKKLGLTTVDMAQVKDEVERDMSGQAPPERTDITEKEADEFIDKLMEKGNPSKEEGQNENPIQTRTESRDRSVRFSKEKEKVTSRDSSDAPERGRRKSVRKELKEIKDEQSAKREADKTRSRKPSRTNEHKHAPRKKDRTKKDNSGRTDPIVRHK